MGVLPIPHGFDDLPVKPRQNGAFLTLSYLGGARGDKGFHLLPKLIDAVINDPVWARRVRFQIQTNFGISREEGLMAATLRSLKAFSPDHVHLIETPLESDGFQAALQATDLLLLPYDPATYRFRSSGLLIQAMAAGIPVIVPDNTSLSATVNPDAALIFGSNFNLIDAVKQALASFDHLAQAAAATAPRVKAAHTTQRLVERLIAV